MTNIYMAGVNHLDEAGPAKLTSYLEEIMPEVVLLEGSETVYEDQMVLASHIKQEISRRNVDPQLAKILLMEQELKGYEFRVSKVYCDSRCIPGPEYLNDTQRMIAENGIRDCAMKIVDSFVLNFTAESAARMMELARYKRSWTAEHLRNEMNSGYQDGIFLGENDRKMASKLYDVVRNSEGKAIVTVTGQMHMIVNTRQNSFYCRISHLNPDRRIL